MMKVMRKDKGLGGCVFIQGCVDDGRVRPESGGSPGMAPTAAPEPMVNGVASEEEAGTGGRGDPQPAHQAFPGTPAQAGGPPPTSAAHQVSLVEEASLVSIPISVAVFILFMTGIILLVYICSWSINFIYGDHLFVDQLKWLQLLN